MGTARSSLRLRLLTGFLSIDYALPGVGFGDFNGDGKLDLIAPSLAGTPVFLQTLASVTPNALAFGNQSVGTKSAPQTVVLKNIDTAALTISGITIVGADAQDFIQTNKCGTSLPPGHSCQIHVSFAPKQVAGSHGLRQSELSGRASAGFTDWNRGFRGNCLSDAVQVNVSLAISRNLEWGANCDVEEYGFDDGDDFKDFRNRAF